MEPHEIEELMSEAPHGANHGRRAAVVYSGDSGDDETAGAERLDPGVTPTANARNTRPRVDMSRPQMAGVFAEGGYQLERGTAHRGILFEGEYVDRAALLEAVEYELGFTRAQVLSVYRQGKLSDDQSELRAAIDARMLALSRSGAEMTTLGRILGLVVDAQRHCRAIANALERARWVEAAERMMKDA